MTVEAKSPGLSISRVSKTFAGTTALAEVSFDVSAGALHALVGANGSGKSTLIKVLAGVVRGDQGGVIRVGGSTVPSNRTTPEWARHVGLRFVHQDLALFPDLDVAENIAIGGGFGTTRLGRIEWRALRTQARTLLDRLAIDLRPDTLVCDLSSADRAMVAIARALRDDASSPRVLVFDEPTAALPAPDAARVLALLRELANGRRSVLMVSHRIGELLAAADEATILRDGRVVDTVAGPSLSEHRVAHLLTGSEREHPLASPIRMPSTNSRALEVHELVGPSIRGVSFSVSGGETLGIAGLPGAGCSELLQMIFGAKPIRSGRVFVDGTRVRLRDIGDALRAGIGYVPENRGKATFADLSVTENLSAATLSSYWRRWRLRTRCEEVDADDSMRRFSIRAGSPRQPVWTLSGGNQQKVVVVRWLRRKPRVLLLDEPTRGVDVHARVEITSALREFAASGAAIVVVSSDLEELCALADRLIVLVDGRAVSELSGPSLVPSRVAQLAYAASVSDG